MKTYPIHLSWKPTNKEIDLMCRVLEINRSQNYVGQKFFRKPYYDQVFTCVHTYHTENSQTIVVSDTGIILKLGECDFVISEKE